MHSNYEKINIYQFKANAYNCDYVMCNTILMFRGYPLLGIGQSGGLQRNSEVSATPVAPFVVSDVELSSIGTTEVSIGFTTSANAKAYIDYGDNNSYGEQNSGEWTLNYSTHNQDITDIEPGTRYLYKIVTLNEAGEQATASGIFTTAANGEGTSTPAFMVGGLEVLELTNTKARIQFTASANARAYIEYGTTADYGSRTTGEESFDDAEHDQSIEDLEPGTTYYYRVRATNANCRQLLDGKFYNK